MSRIRGASPPSQPERVRQFSAARCLLNRLLSLLDTCRKTKGPRPKPKDHLSYSYLSATIGSTLVARRAGIEHANRATPVSTIGTITNVNGSAAFTPKSNELISRV